MILRTSAAHEEGGERMFAVTTTEFVGDGAGAVRALRGHEVEIGYGDDGPPASSPWRAASSSCPAELVLLALGFIGTERNGVVGELGLEIAPGGAWPPTRRWATNVDGVFVCGDMARGQSLIVWAIAEGRSAAAGGRPLARWADTALPAPIVPGQLALR